MHIKERVTGYWEVDLGIHADDWWDNQGIDSEMFSVVGVESHSSGFGFGTRDHQFPAKTRKEAEQLADRIREFWHSVGVDDLEYLTYYHQDPNWIFRIRDWLER